jgi:hypothetical protein
MKSTLLRALSLSLLLPSGCVSVDPRLVVVNQSGSSITTEAFLDTVPDYPSQGQKAYYQRALLPPDKSGHMFQHTGSWPAFVKSSRGANLNLIVYILDSLERYPTVDSLIRHRAYKLYVFDRQYLIDNGWKVIIK